MLRYLMKSALLLVFGVVILCGVYPGILWVIGQTLFPFQVNGSIVRDADGKVIGSLLVAQPFTKDEYFQPRPSAASFDATASTSSGYGPSNYALARPRRARARADRHLCRRRQEGPSSSRPTSRRGSRPTRLAETRISSRNGPTRTTASRRAG